jgi:hypothetical protein
MKTGDCCSDFKICEMIAEKYSPISNIMNCKFSSEDKSLCLQCNDEFYLYNNECLLECPKNTIEIKSNKICLDNSNGKSKKKLLVNF